MYIDPRSTLLVPLLFIATVASGHPITTWTRSTDVVLRNVTQFPNGTWVENLAVRSNGQLLVTVLSAPELYQVDPNGGKQPQLIHQFPSVLGLAGIAEVEKDVFAVVGGNLSLKTLTSPPASYSVWKVDMRSFQSHSDSQSTANVTKIADIPEAKFLNGMTKLDEVGNVLISDSTAGVVWRLNAHTGDRQIVIDDPLMKPPAGPIPLGINGIAIRKGHLYFINTVGLTFNRVAIQPNGTAAGAAEVVAKNGADDDFTFDRAGNAFVMQNTFNSVQRITPEGAVTTIVGSQNSTELVGPTAAHFGRTNRDASTLYVTTSGGLAAPVNGTFSEGGRVVAIKLPTLV